MSRRTDFSPLSAIMRQLDAVADGAPPADTLPTGFPSVDRMLGGGLRRGDLVVLGGDVGSGKSALALAIALRATVDGQVAAFYSGEMSVERVLERVLAIEGRARIDDIRRGALDEATRASVGGAAVRLRDTIPRIEVLPSGGINGLADALDGETEVDLVIVDSLQSLASGETTQDESLASAARQLKRLAIESNKTMFVTAHLPALPGDRDDRRPRLDDFATLGAVKQQADVVLGVFREEMYQPSQGVEGATELLVLKNRNGQAGYVDLYFYKQWMRFEDMLDPDR